MWRLRNELGYLPMENAVRHSFSSSSASAPTQRSCCGPAQLAGQGARSAMRPQRVAANAEIASLLSLPMIMYHSSLLVNNSPSCNRKNKLSYGTTHHLLAKPRVVVWPQVF